MPRIPGILSRAFKPTTIKPTMTKDEIKKYVEDLRDTDVKKLINTHVKLFDIFETELLRNNRCPELFEELFEAPKIYLLINNKEVVKVDKHHAVKVDNFLNIRSENLALALEDFCPREPDKRFLPEHIRTPLMEFGILFSEVMDYLEKNLNEFKRVKSLNGYVEGFIRDSKKQDQKQYLRVAASKMFTDAFRKTYPYSVPLLQLKPYQIQAIGRFPLKGPSDKLLPLLRSSEEYTPEMHLIFTFFNSAQKFDKLYNKDFLERAKKLASDHKKIIGIQIWMRELLRRWEKMDYYPRIAERDAFFQLTTLDSFFRSVSVLLLGFFPYQNIPFRTLLKLTSVERKYLSKFSFSIEEVKKKKCSYKNMIEEKMIEEKNWSAVSIPMMNLPQPQFRHHCMGMGRGVRLFDTNSKMLDDFMKSKEYTSSISDVFYFFHDLKSFELLSEKSYLDFAKEFASDFKDRKMLIDKITSSFRQDSTQDVSVILNLKTLEKICSSDVAKISRLIKIFSDKEIHTAGVDLELDCSFPNIGGSPFKCFEPTLELISKLLKLPDLQQKGILDLGLTIEDMKGEKFTKNVYENLMDVPADEVHIKLKAHLNERKILKLSKH